MELEGRRLLSNIPTYTPGSINDEPVNVMVSYRIELEKQNEISQIASVDIPPTPQKCKNKGDKRACLAESITKYVNKSFNTNILRSRKKGNSIFKTTANFIINEEGKVVNVTAEGENDIINNEAVRVIKTIPSMQPAILDDKPVSITYSLPIAIGVSSL